jgi:hypothetical protein
MAKALIQPTRMAATLERLRLGDTKIALTFDSAEAMTLLPQAGMEPRILPIDADTQGSRNTSSSTFR